MILAVVGFIGPAFLFGPVISHFNQWLFGSGGDGNGAAYVVAQRYLALRTALGSGKLPVLLGAPFPYTDSGQNADPLWWNAGANLSRFLTPVGAVNALVFAGFTFTCIATYTLVRQSNLGRWEAILATLIYGYCPIRVAEAQEHFLLLDEFWFIIEFYLLIMIVRRRGLVRPIFLGILVTITELDNPYLGYFAAILAVMWFFSVGICRISRKDWISVGRLMFQSCIAVAISIMVAIPTQWSLIIAPKAPPQAYDVASSVSRSLGDLNRLSLRWWNFFLPFPENPIIGDLGRSAFDAHLGVDTVTEQSTMIGYTGLSLSVLGVFYIIGSRSRLAAKKRTGLDSSCRDYGDDAGTEFGVESSTRQVMYDIPALALVCVGSGILFGLPPQIQFGSISVPTPPYFVHAILPEIRTTSRIDLLIELGVAVLAGFGVSFVMMKIRPSLRGVVGGALALTVILEYINVPPWHYVELLPPPAVYRWLASLPDSQAGIVAQYPLEASDLPATAIYAFYAYDLHHHPLFNGVLKGTPPDALRRNLLDPLNPTSPAAWAALGVRTVTMASGYFRELYQEASLQWDDGSGAFSDKLPAGYALRYQDNATQGYSVVAAPASLLAGLPEHYGDADLRSDGRLWQRIGTDTVLWLDNPTHQSTQAVIWTLVHNNGNSHSISWPTYVPVPVSLANDSTPLAIVVMAPPGIHSMPLHVDGAASPMSGTGNTTPVTVELRSLEPAPVRPFDSQFVEGGTTRWVLAGAATDACIVQAGGKLDVALLWHIIAPTNTDQTVFLHLIGSSNQVMAQADGRPDAGSIRTSQFISLSNVSDAHALALPRSLAPGRYQLQAGLYNPNTLKRIAINGGGDSVTLGSITVVRPSDGPERVPCPW